jgi:phenylacetic acid degradation operon negative regulatory protein
MTRVELEAGARPIDQRRYPLPTGTAPSLLLTVLGELVLPLGEPVWTASLLYVLTGLGIREHVARQAISRAASTGWIEGEKLGREVRWRLTDSVVATIEDVTRRVMSLSAPPERWDRNCLILSVTIPEEKRSVRKPLYRELGWAGFGNPAPGLWASPHANRLDEVRRLIHRLGLQDSTFGFVGTTAQVGIADQEIVARAWNLESVAQRYTQLLATFAGVRPGSSDERLFTHLALVHEWRKLPSMDPQLPRDLLPDWIGRHAVRTIVDLHRRWTPLVRDHWQEVMRATSPASNAPG